ncbi:MAG: transcription termination factor Rho [Desulfomonile tiedjei]|nr:transcription termination factor Rho [Desulfomonile tiedjei]
MGKKKEQKEKKEKPLDRWTVKELREEALTIPDIQGVHGMNKDELLTIIKEARGIVDADTGKKGDSLREIKEKVVQLRIARDEERSQGVSRLRLSLLRRRIARLKKKTRRAG